ncbi:AzlC family ABC transporter permease [Rahnella sp. AA]|uniref:AzlC family ABC transporter permease n=1 Tax=Rahnella sp. AA TaxID=2057180 RepID=UPI00267FA609
MMTIPKTADRHNGFVHGAIAMLPLCLSVIPWGILAGSMAVQSGLTFSQSLGMSAIVYAGAAQLVTLAMLMSGASAPVIVISVFFLTAQHFLYGLTLRQQVSAFAARLRIPVGFLLTDELFALSASYKERDTLTPGFMIGAGLTFYFCWVICSLAGIVMASSVPNLARFHLDFSIIATFASLVIPMINRPAVLAGVCSSLGLSMLFTALHFSGAIIIAGLSGMGISLLIARLCGEKE